MAAWSPLDTHQVALDGCLEQRVLSKFPSQVKLTVPEAHEGNYQGSDDLVKQEPELRDLPASRRSN
jgi:hypothetical protein